MVLKKACSCWNKMLQKRVIHKIKILLQKWQNLFPPSVRKMPSLHLQVKLIYMSSKNGKCPLHVHKYNQYIVSYFTPTQITCFLILISKFLQLYCFLIWTTEHQKVWLFNIFNISHDHSSNTRLFDVMDCCFPNTIGKGKYSYLADPALAYRISWKK